MLLVRALAAFLALPSMVAGLVPTLIVVGRSPRSGATLPAGVMVLAVGVVLLGWCVRDFFVIGRGTLAPWDPPRHLVVVGLYRFVRNPMYVAVLTIVAGWALLYRSLPLVGYVLFLAVAFHLRVVVYEEPRLARMFGPEWSDYRGRVSRWWPRLPRKR